MTSLVCSAQRVFVFACVLSGSVQAGERGSFTRVSNVTQPDKLMTDLFHFWEAFRDPDNGLYCDGNNFETESVCGGTMMYSSAGTGMGLIVECVFAELGLLSHQKALSNVRETLATLKSLWPRERHHGFYGHFTKRSGEVLTNLGEYSTVDTAELFMGALFAGNYFGGDIKTIVESLAAEVKWSDCIDAADKPTIRPKADPHTGDMTGVINPYNEYYILAYIAKSMDSDPKSKASQYFETYHASSGKPVGSDGHPVYRNYYGYSLLTDQASKFMSSFIPLFCWYQTKAFQKNKYYKSMLKDWLQADMKYWDLITNDASEIWGRKVKGHVFGCGAGAGHDSGYTVNRIDGSEEPIFDAAIMAGFLAVDDASLRGEINTRLKWLMDNGVCTYEKKFANGRKVTVPWRCSLKNPNWTASGADSIDYSTMVLGYALNFLPNEFYGTYACCSERDAPALI